MRRPSLLRSLAVGLGLVATAVLGPIAPIATGQDQPRSWTPTPEPLPAALGQPSEVAAQMLAGTLGSQQSAADGTTNLATFLGQVDLATLGVVKASDIWGYTAPSGREYAIICLWDATAFIEVSNPTTPVVIDKFSGAAGTWRDAKVFEDHAYVVSDTGGGIQIFDLSAIDSGTITQLASVTTPGTLNTHNVAIDEASGFLYRTGGTGEGLRIYDLNASKTAPPHVASWNAKYVHDAQVVTYTSGPAAGFQIAYCFTGSDLTVLNVTNKSSIVVIDTLTYPGLQYCHQGWLDSNGQYLYINDEQDEINLGVPTTTYIADVTLPNNVSYVGKFDNGLSATGHNCYVNGDLLFESNNADGLRVFDLSVDPLNPPEVAWYDTNPSAASGFVGLWSIYPYFPSGIVVGSDRQEGLLIWTLEEPLLVNLAASAPEFVQPTGQTLPVTITEGSSGNLAPGTETLHFDDGSGWQSVPLVSLGGTSYEAQFPALACGNTLDYYFSAESQSGLTWTDPAEGQATPYFGLIGTSKTVTFTDDFETDKGWTPENVNANDGDFERGVPVLDAGWPYAPDNDSDGSGQCWLTDNTAGNSDVDGGTVRLVSPGLDLTIPNPVVQYDYWTYLSSGVGSDYLRIKADDNAGSGFQTVVEYTTNGIQEWRRDWLTASDFTAAGVSLTANVTLRFIATDAPPDTIVEVAIDAFEVFSLECSATTSYCTAGTSASGCQATLASTGSPSLSAASGFDVSASNGEGSKDGLFFFSQNGQQANTWGNGTSFQCVVPPVQRTPVIAGVGANNTCTGQWSLDFNAWMTANPGKAPTAGSPTQVQFWYRDPQNTSNQTTSLSDAAEFTVAP